MLAAEGVVRQGAKSPCCAGCGYVMNEPGLCQVCALTWGTVERMRECQRLGWERRAEWPAKTEEVAHA